MIDQQLFRAGFHDHQTDLPGRGLSRLCVPVKTKLIVLDANVDRMAMGSVLRHKANGCNVLNRLL